MDKWIFGNSKVASSEASDIANEVEKPLKSKGRVIHDDEEDEIDFDSKEPTSKAASLFTEGEKPSKFSKGKVILDDEDENEVEEVTSGTKMEVVKSANVKEGTASSHIIISTFIISSSISIISIIFIKNRGETNQFFFCSEESGCSCRYS
jgi:hypothetical protein